MMPPDAQPKPTRIVAIYGLYDSRDWRLRYVGQALDPERRLREHRRDNRSWTHGRPLTEWIARMAEAGVEVEMRVLEWVAWDERRRAERRHIRKAIANGCDLLNINPGGQGSRRDAHLPAAARAKRAQNLIAWYATVTPEQLSARAARRLANTSPERRRMAAAKTMKTLERRYSREQRVAWAKAASDAAAAAALADPQRYQELCRIRGASARAHPLCRNGHERTPENTITRRRGAGEVRECRQCVLAQRRRTTERRRAERATSPS